MVDDPGRHEQCRLERRVVEDMKHGRHRTKGGAGPQKHRDQAQMAYG